MHFLGFWLAFGFGLPWKITGETPLWNPHKTDEQSLKSSRLMFTKRQQLLTEEVLFVGSFGYLVWSLSLYLGINKKKNLISAVYSQMCEKWPELFHVTYVGKFYSSNSDVVAKAQKSNMNTLDFSNSRLALHLSSDGLTTCPLFLGSFLLRSLNIY